MYRKTRISEIKNYIQDIDSFEEKMVNKCLKKLENTPTYSRPTLLGEIVDFLNKINVKHKVDKNLNIIIER